MSNQKMLTYLGAVARAMSSSDTYTGKVRTEQKSPLRKKAVKARINNKAAKKARKKQRR
jgi:hypothetical protein